jgi:hypothetical protein
MVEQTQSADLTKSPLLKIVNRDWLMETGKALRTLERIINSVQAADVDETHTLLDPVALTSAMKLVLVGYERQELLAFLTRRELPQFLRRQIAGLLRNPPPLNPPTNVVLTTGVHKAWVYEDVLCHWSPYFRDLLRGHLVEATTHILEDGEYIKEVNFEPDIITGPGLDALVYFVYHGNHEYNDLKPDILAMEENCALAICTTGHEWGMNFHHS